MLCTIHCVCMSMLVFAGSDVHLNYVFVYSLFRTATKNEVMKAYRRLARKWHPDSYDGEDQANAEKMFLDIAAAKEVLSNPGM